MQTTAEQGCGEGRQGDGDGAGKGSDLRELFITSSPGHSRPQTKRIDLPDTVSCLMPIAIIHHPSYHEGPARDSTEVNQLSSIAAFILERTICRFRHVARPGAEAAQGELEA